MKKLILLTALVCIMSSVRAQDANMMKYGLNGGLGYAFGANQGIGIGVGVELDYNLTKTVPFGIFARLDLYHGQLVVPEAFHFRMYMNWQPTAILNSEVVWEVLFYPIKPIPCWG